MGSYYMEENIWTEIFISSSLKHHPAIVNVLCENNQANDYEFCQCNTAFLNHIGLQRRQVISVWQHLNMN
jgi:hypothetical protein